MIDSHCHIDFAEFDQDRERVLNAAREVGVQSIIVPSVSQRTWSKTIKVCQQYDQLYLALGLHPVYIEQHQPHHLIELDELLTQHSVIAVGEIGLDFYDKGLDREKQLNYFAKQLVIAENHRLPIIIHNRKAHDICLQHLAERNLVGGIIHAFNGSIQQAWKYIDMGFLLGFGGMLTYQRSSKLRRLVSEIPMQHIALETDAPDMTVAAHQGQRNSPEYLPDIRSAIASIKNISEREVSECSNTAVRECLNLQG